MKTITYFFILFCLFFVTGCEQGRLSDELLESDMQTRAVKELSYFKDVEYTTVSNGEIYTRGTIYCTEEAEYSFIFSFQGVGGSSYKASIGSMLIEPANGGAFREIKMKLKPGKHICDIHVYFTNCDQSADVRLVIRGINGSLPVGEGGCDIGGYAVSQLGYIGGSEAAHWTCLHCYFTLNSVESAICTSCGKYR
ncbi:MAG: hypothetical protein K2P62_07755 [Phocaeicola sp.]|nr:hypothetical protein [Phocaeicola sp.]